MRQITTHHNGDVNDAIEIEAEGRDLYRLKYSSGWTKTISFASYSPTQSTEEALLAIVADRLEQQLEHPIDDQAISDRCWGKLEHAYGCVSKAMDYLKESIHVHGVEGIPEA